MDYESARGRSVSRSTQVSVSWKNGGLAQAATAVVLSMAALRSGLSRGLVSGEPQVDAHRAHHRKKARTAGRRLINTALLRHGKDGISARKSCGSHTHVP